MNIVATLLVIQMVLFLVTFILQLNSKYNYMLALQDKGYRHYSFYGMKYMALFLWISDFKHLILNREYPDPEVEPLRKKMRRYHYINLIAMFILFILFLVAVEI